HDRLPRPLQCGPAPRRLDRRSAAGDARRPDRDPAGGERLVAAALHIVSVQSLRRIERTGRVPRQMSIAAALVSLLSSTGGAAIGMTADPGAAAASGQALAVLFAPAEEAIGSGSAEDEAAAAGRVAAAAPAPRADDASVAAMPAPSPAPVQLALALEEPVPEARA